MGLYPTRHLLWFENLAGLCNGYDEHDFAWHRIPQLVSGNTLTQNIRDIQEKDRYDIILANPPFGGKEKSQIQQNFPIQSNATELLFLQHFMKTLKVAVKQQS
jgi:type I restriction-modification system DNA methylase subunit